MGDGTMREQLARDIHKAGVTSPDLLAEWLIRQGWTKRNEAFITGLVSGVNTINNMDASPLRPMMPNRMMR